MSCLYLPQPPQHPWNTSTDRGCVSTRTSPSSSLWRLWSACSEKERKKPQLFNHIFNQLSRNSYCVTPVSTRRAQAYSLIIMGRSSTCEVKSSMTTIHMTPCRVPLIAEAVIPRGPPMDSYCELECSRRTRRTHSLSIHWAGPGIWVGVGLRGSIEMETSI